MILPLCVERGIHMKTIVAAGLMMLASASFAAAPESARAKAARLAIHSTPHGVCPRFQDRRI